MGGVLLGNKCFLYVGHNYWHPIIATSFPQDNSSEFSPIMPEEFGEHLTRDQRSLRLDIFYFCCDGGNGDFNCVSLFLTETYFVKLNKLVLHIRTIFFGFTPCDGCLREFVRCSSYNPVEQEVMAG